MPRVRSIFISDVHLGTRACKAEALVDFLREHPADHLYLIGDIVDFWAMSRGIYWTAAQNTVVQKVLRRARHGESVVLIPGNHDEALREYTGAAFGDIRVETQWVHTTADGRRLLLLHGDAFDQVTLHHRWVALLGDYAYELLVRMNGGISWIRRRLGIPGYWSLAGYAKRRIKKAVNFISDFEDSVMQAVAEQDYHGVICGHIHWPELRDIEGRLYANCGDWVDSCTALVEDTDGTLRIVRWHHPPAPPTPLTRDHGPEPDGRPYIEQRRTAVPST